MVKTGKWIKSEEELPVFPECVFEHLPPFLNEVVNNSISVDDRDTILIGAIVCLSVCFHNVCGVYDERIVYHTRSRVCSWWQMPVWEKEHWPCAESL